MPGSDTAVDFPQTVSPTPTTLGVSARLADDSPTTRRRPEGWA
ncbi:MULTISPECIES: hypothetical protein [unclassified Haloferax]|uniref:Uncharacterized protein n=1 Tax=Haloferax sp. Atlit-48N TaxID=2077198 RepID=A0ACD5I0R0_9EURY|nr:MULTISPECIES: hypothetical protein [unclassified Haloferax]